MKNTFGSAISVTLAGESHGGAITVILDGILPGLPFDADYIASRLSLRRPSGSISTARREADEFSVLSGVFEGKTTGTPICLTIPNADTRSRDYEATAALPRPGHADYTAEVKYHGFQDYRGGGHFSGRVTAGLVAAGAVCALALHRCGIFIGTHLSLCGGVEDRPFGNLAEDLAFLSDKSFPVLSPEAGERMVAAIEEAKREGDSVGGLLETAVTGLPAGVGEPWFDSFEGRLSHILFSIPGIKGVAFGSGFGFASLRGSQANDPFAEENGTVVTKSNHSGGINGGITNGMPVLFHCAVRPTPSIAREQDTVDMKNGGERKLAIAGRHDPCIAHRAAHVVNACTAIAVLDLLAERYGTDLTGLSPLSKKEG